MTKIASRGLFAIVSAAIGLACLPGPPKPPNAPEFDPSMVFRDLAKGSSRPMVVDWAPEERASLELRATRGPILVKITDTGLQPLWDCTLPDGKYEFAGVSPKRDHVDAHSDAELAANFPMGFARLRSMLRSGQSISADVRMIGVAELNRASVRHADLPPPCAAATHFVKELTIGGFQFGSTATRAASAGAGIGNIGADATYAGVANRITEEGDFKICESADPESRTAPGRCKGILRIRLVPIDQDEKHAATVCGAGLRWDGRACVGVEPVAQKTAGASGPPPTAPAFECRPGDLNECVAQCRRGNAASCNLAGSAIAQQNRPGSLSEIKNFYTQACQGKSWEGCGNLGDVLLVEGKDAEAAALHGNACLNGVSNACTSYGVTAYFGRGGVRQDRGLSFKLWDRACRLGDFVACANAGVVINKGEGGFAANPIEARRLFDVACRNNDSNGCTNLGVMFETGRGGPGDKNQAFRLFSAACEVQHAAACINAGLLIEESAPGDRTRIGQALQLYERACNFQSAGDGCAAFAENKAVFGNLYTDAQLDRRSCDGGTQSELGCFNAAVIYSDARLGFQNNAKMAEYAMRACKSPGTQKVLCRQQRGQSIQSRQ